MIKSMTGYGQGVITYDNLTITAEIKSLNHRYLDIFTRLPRGFNRLEIDIKKYLKTLINRGKLEVFINLEYSDYNDQTIYIDYNLAKQYCRCLEDLNKALGIEEKVSLQDLLRYNDIIKIKECLCDDDVWTISKNVLDIAMGKLQEMKIQEGVSIKKDIQMRLESIDKHLKFISQRIPISLNDYCSYLEERLRDVFQIKLPEDDLKKEIIMHAEKSDVTEETVRLEIHLQHIIGLLDYDGPVGRKMDFLVQEIYREVNTLGAKALDAQMSEKVVEIKTELEKIREQIQNIE